MATLKTLFICLIGASAYVIHTDAQSVIDLKWVASSLDTFALNLLAKTSESSNNSLNLALSPYTVWSLLCAITEGARKNTAAELEVTLGIPTTAEEKRQFRNAYSLLTKNLLRSANGVNLDISSAIFTSANYPLNSTYERIVENTYDVKITPVNFEDTETAVRFINQKMAVATRNRIKNFIASSDIHMTEVLITSALFFKGQWSVPFNKSATYTDVFYDERGNRQGDVEMMYQASNTFAFSMILDEKATAVELLYGSVSRAVYRCPILLAHDGKMSMIIILPKRSENLSSVLRHLVGVSISTILDSLDLARQNYADESVHVHLPKFSIKSNLNLNSVLDRMGIKDVFSLERADLLGMFNEYLYIQRVLQNAMIEVDEEGTVGAAVAGGTFSYKSTPTKFKANRPFIYLIVDKETRGLIFAGTVSNSLGICATCT